MKKLRGVVEMTFVNGGLSKEKQRPYLQVSNGIEAKFLKISPLFEVSKDTFSSYEKGSIISLEIETDGVDFLVLGIVE